MNIHLTGQQLTHLVEALRESINSISEFLTWVVQEDGINIDDLRMLMELLILCDKFMEEEDGIATVEVHELVNIIATTPTPSQPHED